MKTYWIAGITIFSLLTADAAIATPFAPQAKKSTHSTKRKARKTTKKPRTRIVKTTKKTVVSRKIDPLNAPMVGTWYLLDSEDKFVKSTRIVFSKYGEFEFIGSAWRSKGNYALRDGQTTLMWTAIDNKPVKPGTMKKALPVDTSALRLQLDRFRYGKD